MEPYETSESAAAQEQDTSADEAYGNESNENMEDESGDYSMMTGLEDEPQAGTSGEGAEGNTDGAEEGQGM